MHNLFKSEIFLDFRQNITPPVEVTHFNTTNGSLIFHSLPLNHPNLGDSPLTADVEDLASHPLNAPRLFFHSMEFFGRC